MSAAEKKWHHQFRYRGRTIMLRRMRDNVIDVADDRGNQMITGPYNLPEIDQAENRALEKFIHVFQ